ncbi:MAG: hypothetical protein HY290_08030 [Planctomycetia bacterium]|nr:hypothetical protein [Planctomycetia bacterium]
MRIARLLPVIVFIVACTLPATARSQCCCCFETPTLAERYARADAAVLAKWITAVPKREEDDPGRTTYEIVQISRSALTFLKSGAQITVDSYQQGKKGQLALVLADLDADKRLTWHVPVEPSPRRCNYILHAPPVEAKSLDRLAYYIGYLENADEIIAADAFAEVSKAPFHDIVALASALPRDSLRTWVQDPNLNRARLGQYGLMLSLCGDRDDVPWFYNWIADAVDDFRMGADGVFGGYLLLTGEDGLNEIDKLKLADPNAPFSETYAAMTALRLMWINGGGLISPERLKQSMRQLLERPEVCDLVIADLARWQDWSVQDRVRTLYGADQYNVPSIKRAIVRYMIASTKDVPEGKGKQAGPHVAAGARYLAELRQNDPKTVGEAEKYFMLAASDDSEAAP